MGTGAWGLSTGDWGTRGPQKVGIRGIGTGYQLFSSVPEAPEASPSES